MLSINKALKPILYFLKNTIFFTTFLLPSCNLSSLSLLHSNPQSTPTPNSFLPFGSRWQEFILADHCAQKLKVHPRKLIPYCDSNIKVLAIKTWLEIERDDLLHHEIKLQAQQKIKMTELMVTDVTDSKPHHVYSGCPLQTTTGIIFAFSCRHSIKTKKYAWLFTPRAEWRVYKIQYRIQNQKQITFYQAVPILASSKLIGTDSSSSAQH
jgi:hypothetical protein